MLSFPTLPTDNLYKFLSIFGLIVGLIAFFYPEAKQSELDEERENFNTESSKLKTFSSSIDIELVNLKNSIQSFYDTYKIKGNPRVTDSVISWTSFSAGEPGAVKESDEIKERIKKYRVSQKEYEVESLELSKKSRLFDAHQAAVNKYICYSYFLIPFSIIVMIIGFVLWYLKVQQYQDAIIKEQFQELLNKNKPQISTQPVVSVSSQSTPNSASP